jgi:hypothetical protein
VRLCILAIPFWEGNQHLRLLLLQHLLCYLSGLLRNLLRNLMLSGLLSSHYSDVHKGAFSLVLCHVQTRSWVQRCVEEQQQSTKQGGQVDRDTSYRHNV